ncbi:MAG: hypothetical protein WCD42_13430 [Rhizomicrobium sp.]
MMVLCGLAVTPAHAFEGATTAGGWQVGPVNATDCTARKAGGEVNSTVSFNHAHQMVLTVARPEWRWPPMHRDARLSIDAAKPQDIEVEAVFTLVLFKVTDAVMAARLRQAKSLQWDLPWGKYTANVAGMDRALDVLAQCTVP